MARWKRNDHQISIRRIEAANKKYADLIKNKKNMYEEDYLYHKVNYDPTIYGTRVKQCRESMGYTLEEYASLIGTTAVTLFKVEKGKIKKINDKLMWIICAASQTTPDYLLGITEKPGDSKSQNSKGEDIDCYEPVIFSPKRVKELTVLLKDCYNTDQELFDLVMKVVSSEDSDFKNRVKAAVKGICALYQEQYG